jgi:hypothetical protein
VVECHTTSKNILNRKYERMLSRICKLKNLHISDAYKRKFLFVLPFASHWKDRYVDVINYQKSELQELSSHQ